MRFEHLRYTAHLKHDIDATCFASETYSTF